MRILRRRHADLDTRVAEATRAAETAREEVHRSQVRRETVHKDVIVPLREAAHRNNFAEMIRESLIEGYGERT